MKRERTDAGRIKYGMEGRSQPGPPSDEVPDSGGPAATTSTAAVISIEFDEPDELEDYSDWTVVALREECRDRDLPVSGTKKTLIARLEDDDA